MPDSFLEKSKQTFLAIDSDLSGLISRDELKAAFKA